MLTLNDKSVWGSMHLFTVLCFSLDCILILFGQNTLMSSWPWYKMANLSIVATYLTVIYNNHTNWHNTLNSENFLLLIQAFIWFFTPYKLTKLLSFAIYSALNIVHYIMLDLYPNAQFCLAAIPLLNYLEPTLMLSTAFLDISLIIILLIESVYQKSYWGFAIYTYTWALKSQSSQHAKNALIQLININQFRNIKRNEVNQKAN